MEYAHINADIGVIIGRFQVAELHQGHKSLIDFVVQRHQKVILILGIAPIQTTRENPLDYQSRQLMIAAEYPNIIILPLNDMRDDVKWSQNLDNILSACISPSQSVVLYGSRESFIPYYTGKYKTQELISDNGMWRGTNQRNMIRQSVINSKDFRSGVIWGVYNTYPKVVSTVDAVIFNSSKNEILLGKRNTEDKWRFIGGFAEPKSLTYDEDIKREIKEETGLIVYHVKYIANININDWRYTGIDKIRTTLFMCTVGETQSICANDDIHELRWFAIDKKSTIPIIEEHRQLLDFVLKNYE